MSAGCTKAYTRFSHLKRHVANSHSNEKADKNKTDKNSVDSSDDEDDLQKVTEKFSCKSCPKKVNKQDGFQILPSHCFGQISS